MSALLDHFLEQAAVPPPPLHTDTMFFVQCTDGAIKPLTAEEAVQFQSIRFLLEQEMRDPIPIPITSFELDAVIAYMHNAEILYQWSPEVMLSLASFSDTIAYPKLHWNCCFCLAKLLQNKKIEFES